jgi:hypothetical protein
LNNISLLELVLSCHVTYTSLASMAICGLAEVPVLLLRLVPLIEIVPVSDTLLNNMSPFDPDGELSAHTTYEVVPETAICGVELTALVLRLAVADGAPPPLDTTANRMPPLTPEEVSFHTTYAVVPEVAICGSAPVLLRVTLEVNEVPSFELAL